MSPFSDREAIFFDRFSSLIEKPSRDIRDREREREIDGISRCLSVAMCREIELAKGASTNLNNAIHRVKFRKRH